MRACGVSLYRASLPLLALAVLSGGLLFGLEERVLAESNKKADELEDTIHESPHHTANIADRNWLIGPGDSIYYDERFDPKRAQIRNLTVFEPVTQPYRLARQIHSGLATCADGVCADNNWQSTDGWEQRFLKNDKTVRTPFKNRTISLSSYKEFTLAQVDTSMMTFSELRDYIRRSRASGFSFTEQEVDSGKLAFPAVTLVMTALAIPFAVTTGKARRAHGVGLAMILSVASSWSWRSSWRRARRACCLRRWRPGRRISFSSAAAGYLMLTVRT